MMLGCLVSDSSDPIEKVMAILFAAFVVSSIQDCGGGSSSITNRYVVFILNEKIHLFSCATCIVSDMWSSKCLSSCQSKESNVSESQCTYKTVYC